MVNWRRMVLGLEADRWPRGKGIRERCVARESINGRVVRTLEDRGSA